MVELDDSRVHGQWFGQFISATVPLRDRQTVAGSDLDRVHRIGRIQALVHLLHFVLNRHNYAVRSCLFTEKVKDRERKDDPENSHGKREDFETAHRPLPHSKIARDLKSILLNPDGYIGSTGNSRLDWRRHDETSS